jgi:hypothetical protein
MRASLRRGCSTREASPSARPCIFGTNSARLTYPGLPREGHRVPREVRHGGLAPPSETGVVVDTTLVLNSFFSRPKLVGFELAPFASFGALVRDTSAPSLRPLASLRSDDFVSRDLREVRSGVASLRAPHSALSASSKPTSFGREKNELRTRVVSTPLPRNFLKRSPHPEPFATSSA